MNSYRNRPTVETSPRARRSRRTLVASVAVFALALTACGGDDDDDDGAATTEASGGDSSSGGDSGSSGGDSSSGDGGGDAEVPVDIGASGTATFSSGDTTVTGEITECSIAEPDVSFVVEGETAGVQVISGGGGEVDVVVTGAVEWEGRGTASISGGSVTITGAGSPQDDSAATADFTIDASIESC